MDARELARRLEAQDYRCAYAHSPDDEDGGRLRPGDQLALAYDGCGLIHHACAAVGRVPGDPAAPVSEVQRLRAAIAEHKRAVNEAGPLGLQGSFTHNQLITMAAKCAADERLWNEVG